MKMLQRLLLSICAVTIASPFVATQAALQRTAPYDAELLDALAGVPIQQGGRVKPFRTFAEYTLLPLNERRSFTVPNEARFGALAGHKMSPVEWALDMLLYPVQADEYPVIVVPDREILDLIGLSAIADTKRGRHSWNELQPGIQRLVPFAREFEAIEEGQRSRIQTLAVNLYHDLAEYDALQNVASGMRAPLQLENSQILRAAFPNADGELRFADVLARFETLHTAFQQLDPERDPGAAPDPTVVSERALLGRLLGRAQDGANRASVLAWLPPATGDQETWLSIATLFDVVRAEGTAKYTRQIAAVDAFEHFVESAGDPAALTGLGTAFVTAARALSADRIDASKTDLELSYLRADWFSRAQYLFLFGFLAMTITWLRPRASRWPVRIAWTLAIGGEILVVAGIVQRCILLSRPPVATLYETILFITAILVAVALFIEWVGKRRVALSLATSLGALGMFIAYKFEFHKQSDTLEELQAVLRTNFWLGVHVTTVTMGYAATLLAGFIAHVFLIGKLFRAKRGEPGFYQNIGRMVYGVLCFATLFSTFGTIAGGIWANDSWGRFWGWDPKENGALMIVLWQLVILHGRMGGLWRTWGMCMLAVLGNAVVAFSWWHVNALGIGLHSYGFDAGLFTGTMIFYGTQALVLGMGGAAWLQERRGLAATESKTAPEAGGDAAGAEPALEGG